MGNRIVKEEKPNGEIVRREDAGEVERKVENKEVFYSSAFEPEGDEARLRKNRWKVIENYISRCSAEMREGIRANLTLMEFEFWYRSNRRYTSNYVDRNVLGHTMRGYKLARVLYGQQLATDCIAMVTLHVPMDAGNVRLGADGTVINLPCVFPHGSENLDLGYSDPEGRKFCTGKAYVYSIQYIGEVQAIQKARDHMPLVVSNFDHNFHYELNHVITEPDFGQQGKGCVQGIHFFYEIKDMLKYAGAKGFFADDIKVPCISSPIYEEGKTPPPDREPILQDIIRPRERAERDYTNFFTNSFYARNPGAREFIRALV